MAEYNLPRLTIFRNSTATRWNKDGMLEEVPANTPRYDYDPSSRTVFNLMTYSEFTGNQGMSFSNLVSYDSSIIGYDNSLAFVAAPAAASYVYKAMTLLGPVTASFSCVMEMGDDAGPPTFGFSGTSTDALIIMFGVGATVPTVTPLGGRFYRITNTRTGGVSPAVAQNFGIVKYPNSVARTFRVTAFQLVFGQPVPSYVKTLDKKAGDAKLKGLLVEFGRTNYFSWSWAGEAPIYYDKFAANSLWANEEIPGARYVAKGGGAPPINPGGAGLANVGPYCFWAIMESDPLSVGVCTASLLFYRTSPAGAHAGLNVNLSTGVGTKTGPGDFIGWAVEKIQDIGPNGGVVYRTWISISNPDLLPINAYFYPVNSAVGASSFQHYLCLENSARPTSAILTRTGALARGTDVVEIPTHPSWYNKKTGTIWVEFLAPIRGNGTTNKTAASFRDATGLSYLMLFNYLSGSVGTYRRKNGTLGGSSTPIGAPVMAQEQVVRMALAYDEEGKTDAAAANGVLRVLDSWPGPDYSTINTLTIGGWLGNPGPLDGHVRRFRYFPSRLSDGEVTAMTLPD